MKLSLAIATGRVLLKPKPNFLVDGEGGGCALGMGLTAVGHKIEEPMSLDEPMKVWPWLETASFWLPCECCGKDSAAMVIVHLFDEHVMKRLAEPWTLDEVIDWIASVEPQEPAEQPTPAAEKAEEVPA